MNKHNVVELEGREILSDPLTEMLRDGAMQLISQAVEAEFQGPVEGACRATYRGG